MLGQSTANQSRKKQCFFRSRIERTGYRCVTCGSADSRRKASTSQFPKAFFRFSDRLSIVRVEIMPGIASVVHDYLCCHCFRSLVFRQNTPLTLRQPIVGLGGETLQK